MKVEFLREEAVQFLNLYNLFSERIENRAAFLLANGDVDVDADNILLHEAKKQKYNASILANYKIPNTIRNAYLELRVKEIMGLDIVIIDSPDSSINGVACPACNYVVFETKETGFFEICPVCSWQNDGCDSQEVSSANRTTMEEYIKTKTFEDAVTSVSVASMYKRK